MTTLPPSGAQLIFIGTGSKNQGISRGIYATRLDTVTGAVAEAELAVETPNPGFLAAHPARRIVYAAGEVETAPGQTTGGAVIAYEFDPRSGRLTLLNQQPTGGLAVTHLVADATGRMLITVSFGGAQIVAFPIDADGRLGARTSSLLSAGKPGPNTSRQNKPHPHSVTLSPDNRFAYVCDLGLDRILCYRLDPTAATLIPAGEFPTAAGAGPRHSKFSADGRFFYALNEINSTLAVYACDRTTGALTPSQAVSTLPDDFKGDNSCAEVRIHPNGRFVYASNRGHNSIAVFARNEADGTLARIQLEPCGGVTPRNFNLSPDGAWLVCANLGSNNLATFRIDAATGQLTPSGHTGTVPDPICVLFPATH